MKHETSGEAFADATASGTIADSKHKVLAALVMLSDATAAEVWAAMPARSMDKSKVSARLTELRDLGLVRELDPRVCSVTHHRAIVWEATGAAPGTVPRKRRQTAQATLMQYRALIVAVLRTMERAGLADDRQHFAGRLLAIDSLYWVHAEEGNHVES